MEQFFPEQWIANFEELPTWALFLIAAGALFVLSKGADWLVEAATEGALRIGMPKVIVGATVVSLGTTAPECAVSVMAAINGNAGLALGNAVGSVIADTALIFGLGCLLVKLPADRFILNRQGWVQFGTAFVLAALCVVQYIRLGEQAVITRTMGLCFLGLLALYLHQSVRWSRQHARMNREEQPPPPVSTSESDTVIRIEETHPHFAMTAVRGLIGLAMVLVGSEFTIKSVELLASRFGIPEVVISGTLVAFGTSLPELVVGMTSLRKGHPELLVGNVIGADVLNILFVTGAAAAATPLPIVFPGTSFPTVFLFVYLPFLLAILIYFRLCIFSATRQGSFDRWMGWPLVAAYAGYVTVSLMIGAFH